MARDTLEASHTGPGATRAAGPRRVRAYIGLGSNLGDAAGTLARAIAALEELPLVRVRGVSRLYVTAPVGVVDQPDFHNAVVALDVPGTPTAPLAALELLAGLKAIERAFGRQVRERWGPREVDLDLLVFGRWAGSVERPAATRSSDPAKAALPLTVPHRDAHERLFVLAPLADLAPGLVPPGWGETVATARDRRLVLEGPDAVRAAATWDATRGDWVPLADGEAVGRGEAGGR